MAVVIPARDEEERVAAAIGSVAAAIAAAGELVRSNQVVVVADGCSDATTRRARRSLRATGDVLTVQFGRVGATRAAGVRRVLRHGLRHRWPTQRLWVANTDADSVVPADWITRQLRHAQRGAVAVAGVVELDDDAAPSLRRAFRVGYDAGIDTDEHTHVHGANLGVRGDALVEVGNWRPLATGEDHDLWHRLAQLDADLVRDPELVVRTSARTDGRAPAGFSADLADLADRADCAERHLADRANRHPAVLDPS